MAEIEREELEDAVDSALNTINIETLRCHEAARLIKSELNQRGHKAAVKDGIVIYTARFLETYFAERLDAKEAVYRIFLDRLSRAAKREELTMPSAHSRCEVGGYVAEYNSSIDFLSGDGICGVKIIAREEELVDNVAFAPIGREYKINGSTFIYIPPICTKLRI